MASTATSAILAPRNMRRLYPIASRRRKKAVPDERAVGPIFIEHFGDSGLSCTAP